MTPDIKKAEEFFLEAWAEKENIKYTPADGTYDRRFTYSDHGDGVAVKEPEITRAMIKELLEKKIETECPICKGTGQEPIGANRVCSRCCGVGKSRKRARDENYFIEALRKILEDSDSHLSMQSCLIFSELPDLLEAFLLSYGGEKI